MCIQQTLLLSLYELVLSWVTKLAMDDNIEKVSGPMLVKLLEERQTLVAYFYDGSMSNDVRYIPTTLES